MEDTRRILAAVRAKEPGAGDRLVRRYAPQLARHARRLVDRRRAGVEAEDVVHATWVRVFSGDSLARFEPRRPGAFAAWLRRVLRRTLLDELRSRSALKRGASVRSSASVADGGGALEPALMVDPDPSPTSRARYGELVGFCRGVLSAREWELWERVEIGGKPIVDAAHELGVSDSAARALLHRARGKLLRALRPPT